MHDDTMPLSADALAILFELKRIAGALETIAGAQRPPIVRGEAWPGPLMPPDWNPPPDPLDKTHFTLEEIRWEKFRALLDQPHDPPNPPCSMTGDGS